MSVEQESQPPMIHPLISNSPTTPSSELDDVLHLYSALVDDDNNIP